VRGWEPNKSQPRNVSISFAHTIYFPLALSPRFLCLQPPFNCNYLGRPDPKRYGNKPLLQRKKNFEFSFNFSLLNCHFGGRAETKCGVCRDAPKQKRKKQSKSKAENRKLKLAKGQTNWNFIQLAKVERSKSKAANPKGLTNLQHFAGPRNGNRFWCRSGQAGRERFKQI